MNFLSKVNQSFVKEIAQKFELEKSGTLLSVSAGHEIILDWEFIDSKLERLNEKIRSISKILVDSYTKIEMDFCKHNPEAVRGEFFLKSLSSIFEKPISLINWEVVESKIRDILNSFFVETNWTEYSGANEIHLFVTAKDKINGSIIGVVQFIFSEEYVGGTVKAALYSGIIPVDKYDNLSKILLSVVFKILPNIQRVFLHTRVTNESGINEHLQYGFTKFPADKNLPHWVNIGYNSENPSILQDEANTLI